MNGMGPYDVEKEKDLLSPEPDALSAGYVVCGGVVCAEGALASGTFCFELWCEGVVELAAGHFLFILG